MFGNSKEIAIGTESGIRYKILELPGYPPMLPSYLCGYIEILSSERKCRLENVHGGITYVGPVEDGKLWIGFDCCHYGDTRDVQNEAYVMEHLKNMIEQIVHFRGGVPFQVPSVETGNVNDHICQGCGNDRCSKTETSCWKCGMRIGG